MSAKLAGETVAGEIVATALAMYMMKADQPHRFVNEQAFRAQTVRRILFLGDAFVAKRYDHASGKQRLIYRESSPKGVAILGHWLATAFGPTGLRLAELEQKDTEREAGEREAVRKALARLS